MLTRRFPDVVDLDLYELSTDRPLFLLDLYEPSTSNPVSLSYPIRALASPFFPTFIDPSYVAPVNLLFASFLTVIVPIGVLKEKLFLDPEFELLELLLLELELDEDPHHRLLLPLSIERKKIKQSECPTIFYVMHIYQVCSNSALISNFVRGFYYVRESILLIFINVMLLIKIVKAGGVLNNKNIINKKTGKFILNREHPSGK